VPQHPVQNRFALLSVMRTGRAFGRFFLDRGTCAVRMDSGHRHTTKREANIHKEQRSADSPIPSICAAPVNALVEVL